MNGQVSETQWYIARDGKQHGPLTDVEMRTFVTHNYLRASDLIWRPGMADWQPATAVFPAVFPQTQAPYPQPQPSPAIEPAADDTAGVAPDDFEDFEEEDQAAPRSVGRRLATAAVILAVLGGGAFAVSTYQEPLKALFSNPNSQDKGSKDTASTPTVSAPAETTGEAPAASEASAETATASDTAAGTQSNPAEAQTAALAPTESTTPAPPVDGSDIDTRLQKIPVWALLKKDYHDWYETTVGEALKMTADKRPESDVAMHLAQGLVALRRQNAEKALESSPERLKELASAFLANLQALQARGVSACYGFISKGETSPAIVQLMQSPETATAFNAHVKAIFEAIADGQKTPTKHEAAVKGDYDVLIKELGKIGWKEDDLKTFSDPRLLAKRPPEEVCKMVIDWFVAHLAVQDQAVQERLLYETLKPVVTG